MDNANARENLILSKKLSIRTKQRSTYQLSMLSDSHHLLETPLIRAIKMNDSVSFNKIIGCKEVNLSEQDSQGWNALHYAVKEYRYDDRNALSVRLINKMKLLQLKLKTKDGDTALHIAARYGHSYLILQLVRRCPELLSMANKYGRLPLHEAIRNNRSYTVQILLKDHLKREDRYLDRSRMKNVEKKRMSYV